MRGRILLINPALPSRHPNHPTGYLDAIIASERSKLDKCFFERLVLPKLRLDGITRTFHEYPEQTASLGLLSIAASLRDEGYDVEYAQVSLDHSNVPSIVDRAGLFTLVGATAICTTVDQSLQILSAIKHAHPHTYTVLGGPHVTHLEWTEVGDMSGVDMVVRGEGENVMKAIAENLGRDMAHLPGLEFRRDKNIFRTRGVNQLTAMELQKLPTPAYDLIRDIDNTQVYVQFKRGCPYRCRFCAEHGPLRAYTTAQMAAILTTLEKVRRYNLIFVVDSTFITSERFIASFEEAVRQSRTTNHFTVQTRIKGLEIATLRRLKHSHVASYFFGVENTSDDVLAKCDKDTLWSDIVAGLEAAREFFLGELGYALPPYRANFIQGLPGEGTRERAINLERRRELIERGLLLFVNDSIYQPTPGSTFYDEAANYNLIIPDRFRTALRGTIPEYDYDLPGMSRVGTFLFHLTMRQETNELLAVQLGLHGIESMAAAAIYGGHFPEPSVDYVRC